MTASVIQAHREPFEYLESEDARTGSPPRPAIPKITTVRDDVKRQRPNARPADLQRLRPGVLLGDRPLASAAARTRPEKMNAESPRGLARENCMPARVELEEKMPAIDFSFNECLSTLDDHRHDRRTSSIDDAAVVQRRRPSECRPRQHPLRKRYALNRKRARTAPLGRANHERQRELAHLPVVVIKRRRGRRCRPLPGLRREPASPVNPHPNLASPLRYDRDDVVLRVGARAARNASERRRIPPGMQISIPAQIRFGHGTHRCVDAVERMHATRPIALPQRPPVENDAAIPDSTTLDPDETPARKIDLHFGPRHQPVCARRPDQRESARVPRRIAAHCFLNIPKNRSSVTRYRQLSVHQRPRRHEEDASES